MRLHDLLDALADYEADEHVATWPVVMEVVDVRGQAFLAGEVEIVEKSGGQIVLSNRGWR